MHFRPRLVCGTYHDVWCKWISHEHYLCTLRPADLETRYRECSFFRQRAGGAATTNVSLRANLHLTLVNDMKVCPNEVQILKQLIHHPTLRFMHSTFKPSSPPLRCNLAQWRCHRRALRTGKLEAGYPQGGSPPSIHAIPRFRLQRVTTLHKSREGWHMVVLIEIQLFCRCHRVQIATTVYALLCKFLFFWGGSILLHCHRILPERLPEFGFQQTSR